MSTIKILIADPSDHFRNALARSLERGYQVQTAAEGHQALSMLESFRPDILALDLMMPGIDGISLMQQASRSQPGVQILATTSFVSSYVLEITQQLGVGYLMIKPCDMAAIVGRLEDLTRRLQAPRTASREPQAASELLRNLGVPTKLRGYRYLREAIVLMADNPHQSITKELYPCVALQCGATAGQVERDIRKAVETAWGNRQETVWCRYFMQEQDGHIRRPTNAAFITSLADRILCG